MKKLRVKELTEDVVGGYIVDSPSINSNILNMYLVLDVIGPYDDTGFIDDRDTKMIKVVLYSILHKERKTLEVLHSYFFDDKWVDCSDGPIDYYLMEGKNKKELVEKLTPLNTIFEKLTK